MNPRLPLLAAACLLCLAMQGPAAEAPAIAVDKYQEVDLLTVRATPEKFKNKRVRLATRFQGFKITFPEYMVKSGFKGDKEYLVHIAPKNLPAIAKKDDEMTAVIAPLKKGRSVTAYGKIKEFRSKSKHMLPEYYLELEHLEVMPEGTAVELPPEIQAEGDADLPLFEVAEPPGSAPVRRFPMRRR